MYCYIFFLLLNEISTSVADLECYEGVQKAQGPVFHKPSNSTPCPKEKDREDPTTVLPCMSVYDSKTGICSMCFKFHSIFHILFEYSHIVTREFLFGTAT